MRQRMVTLTLRDCSRSLCARHLEPYCVFSPRVFFPFLESSYGVEESKSPILQMSELCLPMSEVGGKLQLRSIQHINLVYFFAPSTTTELAISLLSLEQHMSNQGLAVGARTIQHGTQIYAYNNLRTNQVVYSFTRALNVRSNPNYQCN